MSGRSSEKGRRRKRLTEGGGEDEGREGERM